MSKYCIYCAELIHDSAVYCHSCGNRQPHPDEKSPNSIEPVKSTDTILTDIQESEATQNAEAQENDKLSTACCVNKEKKRCKKKTFILNLVQNSMLLAVAILLFVFSFLPILKFEQEDIFFDQDVEVSFSAIDYVVFMFDSAKDIDEEDITESLLFEEFEEISDEILEEIDSEDYEDIDDLPDYIQKRIGDMMFILYRLALQSDTVNISVSTILPAITSILYLLATLSFLVFAILNFISSFNLLKKAQRMLKKVTLMLLAATPAILFVTYVTPFAYMGERFVEMGYGVVTNLIVSLSMITVITVRAFIFKEHENKFNIPLRAVAAALSILVICMCFAPIYTTTISTIFKNKETKRSADIPLYVSLYSNYELFEEDLDQIDELTSNTEKKEYFKDTFIQFGENYTKKEVEEGKADILNNQYLTYLFAIATFKEATTFVTLIPILFILAVLFSGIVLQQNLICFMTGRYCRALTLVGKICATAFAALALASAIVVLAFTTTALSYVPKGYTITIHAGIILLTIFAVANCCIPTRITKKSCKKNIEPIYE